MRLTGIRTGYSHATNNRTLTMSTPTITRSAWGSRLGFILASAGSAVGLGAIWKFPYMAGTNGGSAFILPYVLLTIAVGLVVMLIEMSLGRAARGGPARALPHFGGKHWSIVGVISVLAGFLIIRADARR